MVRTCGKDGGGSNGEKGHPGGRRRLVDLGSDGWMMLKRILD
jgi:hypothetical protein